jgi:DNA repair protein RadC
MLKMTDKDLLSILVGEEVAERLSKHSLASLFGFINELNGKNQVRDVQSSYMHPMLAASKELLSRAMIEQIQRGIELLNPKVVKDFVRLKMSHLEHEEFCCLWTNAQRQLLCHEVISIGTINSTSVYPREIVKRAMIHNAHGVIFVHNHPSGFCEPSQADKTLTQQLRTALSLVDVTVNDHIIVAGAQTFSFAENGLILF